MDVPTAKKLRDYSTTLEAGKSYIGVDKYGIILFVIIGNFLKKEVIVPVQILLYDFQLLMPSVSGRT